MSKDMTGDRQHMLSRFCQYIMFVYCIRKSSIKLLILLEFSFLVFSRTLLDSESDDGDRNCAPVHKARCRL